MNYYNENDKFAANWLRELIRAELIPEGHVDERSIIEVKPEDLKGLNNATSLRVSPDGPRRSNYQDGMQTDLFGPDHVPWEVLKMDYDSASIKIMRSYDYCHFEVQLGWNSSEMGISNENVDTLRKEAAILVDKAVEQYKIMKEQMDFKNSSEYDWNRLQTRIVKMHKENPDTKTWTPEMKAIKKRFENLDYQRSMEYHYQDDWDHRYPEDDDEIPF